MADRLEELQTQIEALGVRLRQIERRLGDLEARQEAGLPRARREDAPPGEGPEPEGVISVFSSTVSRVGWTLVVLGGAYLFRAITDAGLIPAGGGVAAGLAYAAWWLVSADRAAAAGQRASAVSRGLASGLIAFPLIWETTCRFGLLGAGSGAALLVVFFALGLTVAWRRSLVPIAWLGTTLALATTLGLLVSTHDLRAASLAFLGIAAGVELTAVRDLWPGLRWPSALAVDGAVLLTTFLSTRPSGLPPGYPPLALGWVIMVGLALPLVYLDSTAVRTLGLRQRITPFEVTQAVAALLIGFLGVVRVLTAAGASPAPVAALALVLGAACYAAGFTFIDRTMGHGANFYAYTTCAGLLTLLGPALLLRGPALALTWCAIAVGALSLGEKFDRITLRFHGAGYLVAGALASGLLAASSDGLLAGAGEAWQPVLPVSLVVAAVALAGYALLLRGRARTSLPAAVWPRAMVATLLVWSSAGLAARLVAGLAGAPGPAADAGVVAAARTAILSAAVVGLASLGTWRALPELTWLVYPLLIGTGAKLLLEDLRHGRPATLVWCLALYGGALIAAPRMLRGRSQ
jgi:hypothetical protein